MGAAFRRSSGPTPSCYTVAPMVRQRLGQHFLADPGWREEIARAIRISPQSLVPSQETKNSCWIEIGAGHGEMTELLASTGAPVYAIELDTALVNRLNGLAKQFPNITVVPSDILETNLAELARGRRLRIYGNVPYSITSPIVHHLFASAELIDEIHLVIQLEVAQRLAAAAGSRDYGYLSVLTQYFSRPELVLKIPRGAFRPTPDVESALVTLRLPGGRAKLPKLDEAKFLDFVKLGFSQKRKTLVNNLKPLAKRDVVRQTLASLNLSPDVRAEQLSASSLAALYQELRPPE
jgi:16S rRNA (adenine1518-N6/adenine1519-N6)-dimethyltransferase